MEVTHRVHHQDHAAVTRPSDELDGTPEHLLGHPPHQRMVDQRRRLSLRLKDRVLGSNLLPLLREERWKPLGVEHIHRRVDQDSALDGAHELAGATHCELPRTGNVNDRVVGPVGHHVSPAPRGSEPGGPGMGNTPIRSFSSSVCAPISAVSNGTDDPVDGARPSSADDSSRTSSAGRLRSERPLPGRSSSGVSRRRKRVGRPSSDVSEALETRPRAPRRVAEAEPLADAPVATGLRRTSRESGG